MLGIQSNGGSLQQSTIQAMNTLAALGIFATQGNFWFVNPNVNYGSDTTGDGSLANPFASLGAALAAATAGQNDVIFLCAASNTASQTTDYQTSTLNWNKNLVHLIGLNSGPAIGQRSRIALKSDYATASNLFTMSASGCVVANTEMFEGVSSALPTGCLKVTGQHNRFANCQISGMGNAANDIAGAYSLFLSGAQENVFEDCYIGLDTITLGAAANSQILCGSQATRNIIRKSRVVTYTNHATNNNFLRCPTGSLDRWLEFEDTRFINPIDASSTNLTQAAIIASDAGGSVLLTGAKTGFVGATDWNSTDSGNVRAINGTVTNSTFGLGIAVTR